MKWNLVKNGHEPSEPIVCPICENHMQLRWSMVQTHNDIAMELFFRRPNNDDNHSKYLLEIFDSVEQPSWVNDMAWKCKHCSFWCMFGVPMKAEDAKRIRMEERNGEATFVPIEEWWGDELIKDKLQSLGYW